MAGIDPDQNPGERFYAPRPSNLSGACVGQARPVNKYAGVDQRADLIIAQTGFARDRQRVLPTCRGLQTQAGTMAIEDYRKTGNPCALVRKVRRRTFAHVEPGVEQAPGCEQVRVVERDVAQTQERGRRRSA